MARARLGALHRVVHLRAHIGRLGPEVGNQQPPDDRQRGKRQRHRSAKVIGEIVRHDGLLEMTSRDAATRAARTTPHIEAGAASRQG